MKERVIFHIDVNNAFLSWTAVLLLKNGYKRDIRKIPSIIGGDESQRHGIVLAKSPIAKKYGIVTAETLYQARKKCPQLECFPADYKWYYEKSKELYNYLSQYSPQIEQYSVDESFLDMTGTNYLYKNYEELAYKIKEDVKEKFGYTVNIGIANNKLCAKMASDFEKPDKVHTLYNSEIKDKMWPLPIEELFMVGKKTSEALRKINIKTIGDLANADIKLLERHFKNHAIDLKKSANGIDDSKVEPRKENTSSISTTETLPYDHTDENKLKDILFRQTEELTRQLRYKKQYAKTVAVIFKNSNFISYSAQAKLEVESNLTKEIYKLVIELFDKNYKNDPIRLIGVRLADLTSKKEKQITLFDDPPEENEKEDSFQETIDNINNKFGKGLIAPASLQLISKKHHQKRD